VINVGKYNELKILKEVDFGIYLGNEEVEVLMPQKWVPEGAKVGDVLNVFVYRDSEDRIIATTLKPFAISGEFAYLEATQVNDYGAFFAWGIEKDLLVPFAEQPYRMREDNYYVVYLYTDERTDRIVASGKINKFLEKNHIQLEANEAVDLLISAETELGYNAVINNKYGGLLYKNEIYENLQVGDRIKGYVKQVREDKKIDLSLQKSGLELVGDAKAKVMQLLKAKGGFLALNDDSSPDEIKQQLQISKKAFKKAVGMLYKEQVIALSEKGIELIQGD
jgi:uncharacterized protein